MNEPTEKQVDAARRYNAAVAARRKEERQFRRKQILGRLIFMPFAFVLVNGGFFYLFWLLGGFKLVEYLKGVNEYLMYPILLIITGLYIGFILLLYKPISKLVDKLKMPWLLDD